MELRKVNIRQRSDSCLIVLIFSVVAHYACIHLDNENWLIVYSNSPAVHLSTWMMIFVQDWLWVSSSLCLVAELVHKSLYLQFEYHVTGLTCNAVTRLMNIRIIWLPD